MGGDPIIIEPTILKFDEDIVDSWKDGKVIINGIKFSINEMLIIEVSRLPNKEEIIIRDKRNQVGQLTKFIRDDETLYWLDSDSLEEGHNFSDPGNFEEGGNSLKVPYMDPIEKGPIKGLDGTQTLIKELHCHLMVLNGLGGFPFKHLCMHQYPNLGDNQLAKGVTIEPAVLVVDKDVHCILEETGLLSFFKKIMGRSSKLQRKSAGKSTPLDVTKSSEEDKKSKDLGLVGGGSIPPKVSIVALSGSAKCPSDSLSLSEEL
eukprot:Gb_06378 [translate_table: standard]